MEYNGFYFTMEELKTLKSLRRKITMDISCRVNSLYEKLKVRYGLSGSPSPYSDDKNAWYSYHYEWST